MGSFLLNFIKFLQNFFAFKTGKSLETTKHVSFNMNYDIYVVFDYTSQAKPKL